MEDKRQRIIEVASKIIIEKGVENTSLADIAQNVGISKGTLYYHFPSKSELILEIADNHLSKITQGFITIADRMASNEKVEDILKRVFESIINDETLNRLHLYLIQEALTNNEELKEKFRISYAHWRNTVLEGLKEVLIDKTDNFDALASVILTCLDGFIVQYLIGVEAIPIYNIANYLINRI